MARSIPARPLLPIVLAAIGGIVLLAVAGALWFLHSNQAILQGHQHRDGELITRGLANAVATDLVRRDFTGLEARLLQTASEPHIRSALVIDLRGQVMARVIGRSEGRPAHPVFDVHYVAPPAGATALVEDREGYLGFWHVVAAGPPIGWVRVEIETDSYLKTMHRMRREVLSLAAVVSAIGLACLGVAVLRSHRLLTRREEELARTHRLLESRAYYDSLTQLPNRELMSDRLNQAIGRTTRAEDMLAVCFVDLDDFKPINDAYGHHVGDLVLIEVARRLASNVRGGDTVARLGGDEFVALLGGIRTAEEARIAVERLLLSLAEPHVHRRRRIAVQASIGYALYPVDCADRYRLIFLADQAMYQAKSAGGATIRRHRPPGDSEADAVEDDAADDNAALSG